MARRSRKGTVGRLPRQPKVEDAQSQLDQRWVVGATQYAIQHIDGTCPLVFQKPGTGGI
jgi:hypothetical protein